MYILYYDFSSNICGTFLVHTVNLTTPDIFRRCSDLLPGLGTWSCPYKALWPVTVAEVLPLA
jgi:hypothetical protein